jgi:hypothetical protein
MFYLPIEGFGGDALRRRSHFSAFSKDRLLAHAVPQVVLTLPSSLDHFPRQGIYISSDSALGLDQNCSMKRL